LAGTQWGLFSVDAHDKWPHSKKLKRLLHANTSLDKIFARTCIPILLTYNSPAIISHTKICAEYKAAIKREILAHADKFAGKSLPANVRIELLLVPLANKKALVDAFDKKLRNAQELA